MGVESSYYQTLTTTTSLTDVIGLRVYPVKLPQNVTYPCMIYDVEVEFDETLDVGKIRGLYSFQNTFYANNYPDIIKITDAFKEISQAKSHNIAGYADLDFVVDKNMFARTLVINVGGTL